MTRILGIGITGRDTEGLISEGVLAIEMGALAEDLALLDALDGGFLVADRIARAAVQEDGRTLTPQALGSDSRLDFPSGKAYGRGPFRTPRN